MSSSSSGGTDAASSSSSTAPRGKPYAEINQLRQALKELQVKCDSQQLLLQQHAGHATAASVAHSVGDAASASSASAASASSSPLSQTAADFLSLQQSNHALQSTAQSLQSALASATEEVDRCRADKESLSKQLTARDELVASLQADLASARADSASLRSERAEGSALLDKLSATVSEYESRIAADETRMVTLEAEHASHLLLTQEKAELESLVDKLRALLLSSSAESSKRNQDLLNALQSCRQFLEELKREYEAFAAASRAENDAYRRTKGGELLALQERFDALRLSQYEQARDAHQDQMDIIEQLQRNYEEYRTMVESLFASEAKALQNKLEQHSAQAEQELRYIVRTKDAAFQQMVTNKDAKIMHLIEGTDFGSLLLSHQIEMEGLRKERDRAIDEARTQGAAETQKATAQLRKELLDKNSEIDRYHTQILSWERKLEQTLALLKKQKKLHALKEEASEAAARASQQQLHAASAQIESLTQVKENLRHRILRLRLQIDGSADDSIQSVIKRLTQETKRLATDLAAVSLAHKGKLEAHAQLQRAHAAQSKQMGRMEKELEKRASEFARLTRTLESVLQLRLKGGVAGVRPGREPGSSSASQSLYDPAVARTLENLSTPFLQALFQHRAEFGLEATMLRGSAASVAGKSAAPMPSSAASGTMVGLRIGADPLDGSLSRGAAHEEDDRVDAALPSHRSDVHEGGGVTVRRTSIMLDASAPHGASADAAAAGSTVSESAGFSAASAAPSGTTSRRSTGLFSANSTADIESSVIAAGHAASTVPSSQRPSRRPSSIAAGGATMLDPAVMLPASGVLSSRASPSLGPAPPVPPVPPHGRHISFNPSASSTLAAAAARMRSSPQLSDSSETGAPSDIAEEDYSQRVSQQLEAHMLQQQQQQHQQQQLHGLGHSQPLAPHQIVQIDEPHRPASRSARLAELIKATPSVSMDGVKRVKPAKSLREQAKREEAARRREEAASAAAGDQSGDAVDPSMASSAGKKSSRPQFSKPSKLLALESQMELVDLDLVRGLERGFDALERFKRSSRAFEADAKGRGKAMMQGRGSRAAAGAMGNSGQGVGAFNRSGQTSVAAISWQAQHAGNAASHARDGAADAGDVTDKSLRVFGATGISGTESFAASAAASSAQSLIGSPSLSASMTPRFAASRAEYRLDGSSGAEDDEDGGSGGEEHDDEATRRREAALALDMREYVDPQQQLDAMGVVSHQGEKSRLYTGGASEIPWWSAAAKFVNHAQPPHVPSAVANASTPSLQQGDTSRASARLAESQHEAKQAESSRPPSKQHAAYAPKRAV